MIGDDGQCPKNFCMIFSLDETKARSHVRFGLIKPPASSDPHVTPYTRQMRWTLQSETAVHSHQLHRARALSRGRGTLLKQGTPASHIIGSAASSIQPAYLCTCAQGQHPETTSPFAVHILPLTGRRRWILKAPLFPSCQSQEAETPNPL